MMRVLLTSVVGGALVWKLLRARNRAAGPESLKELDTFIQEEVLAKGEQTVLLGRFSWQPEGSRALVKLSQRPMSISCALRSLGLKLVSYSGAEYCYYDAAVQLTSLVRQHNLRPTFAIEVIAPASEKQISRARPQPGTMVTETPQLYLSTTLPYIESLDPRSVAWVGHLLDLSKEKERMLYNDPDEAAGFLLNVDTKWKSHPDCHAATDPSARAAWHGHEAVRDLYCLAICHRRDVRSLRDLRAEHLPLLRNILHRGSAVIQATYGLAPEQLRVFVHYQPQFFHFHVHFTRLHSDLGCQVERAHLLQDIIATLEADGAAYTKRTLYYQLKANDALLHKIQLGSQAE